MKQILLITFGALIVVSFIVFGFTFNQTNKERLALSADLQYRTRLLTDTLRESVEPNFLSNSTTTLQKTVEKFADRERIIGLAVFNHRGVPLATSLEMPRRVIDNPDFVFSALNREIPTGVFETIDGDNRYLFVAPLYDGKTVAGALVVVQNAAYIDEAVLQIWMGNLVRFLVQILVFAVAIAALVYFVLFKTLRRFAESIKSARVNKTTRTALRGPMFLRPLASEVTKISQSLEQARFAASLEARMRLEKLDSPWTAERLSEFVKVYAKNRQIFVVSNREPYVHTETKGKITYSVPAHGMVTAVESVMAACGGTWIAHGSGNADKKTSDKKGKIHVPPEEPKYTLKRVWLTEEEIQGHYAGFSNEALFPLCLMSHTRPVFRKEDWGVYGRVNEKFAASLFEEIKDIEQPLVLVQDLHFALLPKIIKRRRPDALVGLFWHHPWPSPEQFSICPWRKDILEGMLGADIIGFNTQQFCNNFIETVGKEIESLIDLEQFSISRDGHQTFIKPFPISIAFTGESTGEDAPPQNTVLEQLNIKTQFLGLGVDRLDYTKGIVERLRGVEHFFKVHPEYLEKFTFLQIAAPSREKVQKYREYGELVEQEVERINQNLKTNGWKPVVFERRHYSHAELAPLFRLTNVCAVTSLHDGMNLVAKEFVAARTDEQGVLILSSFTGASRDLKDALIINPYSIEQISDALFTALTMKSFEQRRRMKLMRSAIRDYNVYRWSAEFIKALTSLG